MSRSFKILVSFMGVIAVIAGLWFLAVSPLLTEKESLLEEISTAESDLEIEKAKLGKLNSLTSDDIALAEKNFESLRLGIPEELDESVLFSDLHAAHAKAGVNISQISIATTEPRDVSGGSAYAVTVAGDGKLANIQNFVKEIQEMPRLLVIDYVQVAMISDGGFSFNIKGNVFVKAGQEAVEPS